MATTSPLLPILLLSLFSYAVRSGSHPNPTAKTYYDFIKSSCGVTRYPDLCYSTLSPYAATVRSNSTQLVNAALQVTLNDAVSACNAVRNISKTLKPKEAGAVMDCVANMKDTVDELKDTVDELKDSMDMMKSGMDDPDFAMEVRNLQTWVSAALTDEDMCMEGIEEGGGVVNGKVKDVIQGRVVRVAQLTSICPKMR
ncbi:Pectinesterase inhibitor 10 [Linum perenne]